MTCFSLLKYFDAFELDVNVVNFVYYGKTRKMLQFFEGYTINVSPDFRFSIYVLEPLQSEWQCRAHS